MMYKGEKYVLKSQVTNPSTPPEKSRENSVTGKGTKWFWERRNNRYYSRAANTVQQMVSVIEIFHHSFPLHLSVSQI